MQEKFTFGLPWQLIKFNSLDEIHMVVRGLLKEYYRFWMCFFSLENLAFRLPWQQIKINDLDKIHIVGRGLLQKNFSKTFVKISAVTLK